MIYLAPRFILSIVVALVALILSGLPALADSYLSKYLPQVPPAELVAGADAFGPIRSDLAVARVMQGGNQIGWVYVPSDFVGPTGYSGKPIHTIVALSPE